MTKNIVRLIYFISFWSFIAIKVAGSSFAAWSWWWILLPIVPFFGLFVQHMGL